MDPIKPVNIRFPEEDLAEMLRDYERILRSGNFVLGEFTRRFEDSFARYVGRAHAVAMSSCTSALEALLLAHGASGRFVAVPTNTNFATVAAILRGGGKPVFLDMTLETFMPDLEQLRALHEEHPSLKGVVWVHIGGLVSPQMQEVAGYCRRHGLFLIEDAAHAHGSQYKGMKAGAFGDAAAFSFYATKVITTMEGGMAVTDSAEVAGTLRALRNQGMRGGDFGALHHELGASWRLSEVAASMGLVQLRRLDAIARERGHIAERYREALAARAIATCNGAHMDQASHYKLIVRLPAGVSVGAIKKRFRDRGVVLGGGVYEVPCHLQPVFRNLPLPRAGLPQAEAHCPHHICPPLREGMSERDQERVIEAFACIVE